MEEATTTTTETGGRLDKSAIAKLVVAVAVVAVFVIFAVQNTDSIDVELLAWSFALAKIFLMLLSAIVGIVVWELAGFLRRRRAKGS